MKTSTTELHEVAKEIVVVLGKHNVPSEFVPGILQLSGNMYNSWRKSPVRWVGAEGYFIPEAEPTAKPLQKERTVFTGMLQTFCKHLKRSNNKEI